MIICGQLHYATEIAKTRQERPHFRIIVGKKKKEDVPAAQAKADSTVTPATTETASAPSEQNSVPGNAHATRM
jgi:hypothetical protein